MKHKISLEGLRGEIMLAFFRKEQSKHGNDGCICNTCAKDMDNALKEYISQFLSDKLDKVLEEIDKEFTVDEKFRLLKITQIIKDKFGELK